jgi:hypothetical protein
MRNSSRIFVVVGVVVGVVGLGLLLGWWGSRQNSAPSIRPIAQTLSQPAPAPADSAPLNPPEPIASRPTTVPPPPVTSPVPAAANTNLSAAWEDKLDDILGSDEDDTNRIAQLFAMFPNLPEDGQEEVAQHLSNLVPDDNYSQLGQLLLNAQLPQSVLDVLMSDVLNRPNSVKLPLLLQVAQNSSHPEAAEAKDLMELYLDEQDPAQWPDKMKEWLKENPD